MAKTSYGANTALIRGAGVAYKNWENVPGVYAGLDKISEAGKEMMDTAVEMQERAGEQQAEALRLGGEEAARGLEWSKTGTLLGMSQERLGAANQARAEARAQQMSAVGDIGAAGMQYATAKMKIKK